MPQMFPMNWILMFTLFILIFIVSINKIFFSPNSTSIQKPNQKFLNYLNSWKW